MFFSCEWFKTLLTFLMSEHWNIIKSKTKWILLKISTVSLNMICPFKNSHFHSNMAASAVVTTRPDHVLFIFISTSCWDKTNTDLIPVKLIYAFQDSLHLCSFSKLFCEAQWAQPERLCTASQWANHTGINVANIPFALTCCFISVWNLHSGSIMTA